MSAEQKTVLRRITSHLMETIYPSRCLACPTETVTPMGLCGDCWGQVHFFSGPICDLCGISVHTIKDDSRGEKPGSLICHDCDRHPPNWDHGRSAIAYEGVGRQITLALKHSDRIDMAAPLARWMSGAAADIVTPQSVLVPVPLHWSRQLRRRYNQSAVLAFALGARLQTEVLPTVLKRNRATPFLQNMSRKARQDAVSGSISINQTRSASIKNRHVLLIDDVMTTGATLSECSEVCRNAGAASVNVLTLARVDRAV